MSSNVEYISKVYLLSVPLENDYKNTLYFNGLSDQLSYFQSKIKRKFIDFSYQRKDNIIRIPDKDLDGKGCKYDELLSAGINYVMYQNSYYSNKWFYCFIKNLKYINDGMTELEIETDVMQTWMTDYTVKESFVEREHVNDDSIGNHTFPEQLETGEYICNERIKDTELNSTAGDLTVIMASTLDITKNSDGKFPANGGGEYGGIYSGLKYYRFDNRDDLDQILKDYVNAGQDGSISSIFIAPKVIAPVSSNGKTVMLSSITKSYYKDIVKNIEDIDGYIPRNNKLFCYPYQYLLVSNNTGGSAIYKYEDFEEYEDGKVCTFKIEGVLCPGCSIRLIPVSYKGVGENDEEGINLGKYPICNWQSDVYTNWLVQNSTQIALSKEQTQFNAFTGILSSARNLDLGGAISAAANAGYEIKKTMAEVEKQSLTPPQARGNTNCGDVITSSNNNTFHFYKMNIKKEYAKKLDAYFDCFGYQVNTIKIPNKNHRQNYWYTKTIDVNIDGNIPNDDMQKIKNCYNNGITFWKDANDMNNYSVENGIV